MLFTTDIIKTVNFWIFVSIVNCCWRLLVIFYIAKFMLVSAIFYQIFMFFLPNDSPSKTKKCFLFHLKSSFCSRDIKIFVIFCLSTLSRYKRTNGSGIIYDVMNCCHEFLFFEHRNRQLLSI